MAELTKKERKKALEVIQSANSAQEALLRVDSELDSIRAQIRDSKSREVSPTKVALISGVCIIASTSLVPVVQSFLDDPELVSCSAEREDARDLYRADGVWTDLPESSTVEKQCKINTYIVNLPKPDTAEPDPSGSSSGGSSSGSWGGGGRSSSYGNS